MGICTCLGGVASVVHVVVTHAGRAACCVVDRALPCGLMRVAAENAVTPNHSGLQLIELVA